MADPASKTIQDKFSVQNPPEHLTMVDVMGIAQQYGGFAKSCRYFMRIRPQGKYLLEKASRVMTEHLSYLTEAAEMPGRAFLNVDGRYFGPNFKIPIQSQYEDTSVTFLCRNASYERKFFDDWMEIINPTNLWDFNYRDDYSALIDIYQLTDIRENKDATAPIASYQWTLHDAYPVVVNPQQVTWADDNFQRLTITFTYTKWTRPNLDKKPSGLTTQSDFIRGSTVTGLPLPNKM